MANVNSAFGFRRVGSYGVGGGRSSREYVIPSADGTAVFKGDAVKSGGTSKAATGDATVVQAAAGDTVRGVVEGFTWPANSLPAFNVRHRLASTRVLATVCDDPSATFEAQEDAGGATTALVDVGENCDIVVGSGSTITGVSAMQVDSSTHTASSAQVRILGFMRRADNTAASANSKLLVMFNEHEFKSTSGV